MPTNKTEQAANATPGHVASTDGLGALLESMVIAAYREGGRKKLAERLGISQSMLSGMLNRHKPVPDSIAQKFGYTRRVVYERTSA